jgi:hypothetical protein
MHWTARWHQVGWWIGTLGLHLEAHSVTEASTPAGQERQHRPLEKKRPEFYTNVTLICVQVCSPGDGCRYAAPKPFGELPLNPQGVQPLNPHAVQPLNPHAVQPLNPHAVQPLNPHAVQPLNPHAVQPLNPHAVQPLNPHAVQPLNPHAVQPLNPHAVQP